MLLLYVLEQGSYRKVCALNEAFNSKWPDEVLERAATVPNNHFIKWCVYSVCNFLLRAL